MVWKSIVLFPLFQASRISINRGVSKASRVWPDFVQILPDYKDAFLLNSIFLGEYSNPPMEELFEWINSSLPLNVAFAGRVTRFTQNYSPKSGHCLLFRTHAAHGEFIAIDAKVNIQIRHNFETVLKIWSLCFRPIVNHPHYEDSGLRNRWKFPKTEQSVGEFWPMILQDENRLFDLLSKIGNRSSSRFEGSSDRLLGHR